MPLALSATSTNDFQDRHSRAPRELCGGSAHDNYALMHISDGEHVVYD